MICEVASWQTLGVKSVSGPKALSIDLGVAAKKFYPSIHMSHPMEEGLGQVTGLVAQEF